jgi:Spy/CpxP family protein refolding chaperone
MRKTLLATAILVNALALGGTAGHADSMTSPATTVPQAPIGHLQPRAQPVSPLSSAEQAEQQQMSAYDAEQQKLDGELDKQLNICRGC